MSDEPLQFDKAEHDDAVATTCVRCATPLRDVYWEAHGALVCTACKDSLALRGIVVPRLKPMLWGLGAAALGAVAWGLMLQAGYQAAIVSIGIAWGVARAIRLATGGHSSRFLQVFAVVITYLSVSEGFLVAGMLDKDVHFTVFALPFMAVFAVSMPFQGLHPLSLLIIGFGLYSAWRRTEPGRLHITGPYQLASRTREGIPGA